MPNCDAFVLWAFVLSFRYGGSLSDSTHHKTLSASELCLGLETHLLTFKTPELLGE